MERLTQNNFDYCLEMCEPECAHKCPFYKDERESKCHTAAMYDKLREYEDMGLSPEEVREKLSKLTRYEDLFDQRPYFRWREIAEAEDDGRIAILPCKVGSTVFVIKDTDSFAETVVPVEVAAIKVTRGEYPIVYFGGTYPLKLASSSELGKSFYLTRAEAEAALKGVSEDG